MSSVIDGDEIRLDLNEDLFLPLCRFLNLGSMLWPVSLW